jgi:CHRD domain-containing protein
MRRTVAVVIAVAAMQALGSGVSADHRRSTLRARLAADNEIPIVISAAQGEFRAKIDDEDGAATITYELSYEGLEGSVTQSHIHAAQPGVNGGIMIWLCSNLASPPTPPGTQPCPQSPGTITGTITAADVVGVATQAIPAGSLSDPLEAIRSGNAYVNVHSNVSPGGELRGQIK